MRVLRALSWKTLFVLHNVPSTTVWFSQHYTTSGDPSHRIHYTHECRTYSVNIRLGSKLRVSVMLVASPLNRPAKHNRENATDGENIIIDLLQEISEVLRSSTIVEERGKDATSKFWAAYKKVSSEYDDDMLERWNSNMDIVLIFAGLFSAVNTAFIIAMQPNPVDTANVLLAQLVQISLNGSSVVQPMIISSSTGYSSSDFWTQALAYTSLVFSLLAAFGAVLGKQWLGYYKTNRYVRGSLEERCKQRHRKF
ncbi:hypothetical protein M405DRAFT_88131, partial [Rhizopogon salebrosus TDB-379]